MKDLKKVCLECDVAFTTVKDSADEVARQLELCDESESGRVEVKSEKIEGGEEEMAFDQTPLRTREGETEGKGEVKSEENKAACDE